MEERNPFDDAKRFESELGLPDGWFWGLVKEGSDWAFVIKLHALLEAAIVHVIDARLSRPELRDYVERLNVGGHLGKIAFAKALKAIEPKHERFIRALSRIRNDCVHDVRNVGFDFKAYIDAFRTDDRQRFLAAFHDLLRPDISLKERSISRDEFVLRYTRFALWFSALAVIAELYVMKESAQLFQGGLFGMAARDLLGK